MSDEPKCPSCGSTELHYGYGLAGGGIGVYTACMSCGTIFDKVQDPEMEGEDDAP